MTTHESISFTHSHDSQMKHGGAKCHLQREDPCNACGLCWHSSAYCFFEFFICFEDLAGFGISMDRIRKDLTAVMTMSFTSRGHNY